MVRPELYFISFNGKGLGQRTMEQVQPRYPSRLAEDFLKPNIHAHAAFEITI